jgi:hypothetical protein
MSQPWGFPSNATSDVTKNCDKGVLTYFTNTDGSQIAHFTAGCQRGNTAHVYGGCYAPATAYSCNQSSRACHSTKSNFVVRSADGSLQCASGANCPDNVDVKNVYQDDTPLKMNRYDKAKELVTECNEGCLWNVVDYRDKRRPQDMPICRRFAYDMNDNWYVVHGSGSDSVNNIYAVNTAGAPNDRCYKILTSNGSLCNRYYMHNTIISNTGIPLCNPSLLSLKSDCLA